jgi:hypothetical protein
MSYIGQQLPADSFQGFTTDSFAGDGSATTFTLSKTPFNESALLVVINNVVQKPTTNFTVSGTTLTIVGTAVASGDVIYATHIGGALPIGQAASLDLNGASDQLILDADADTTISADTDDQIDIKIAGADDFQFTANTFTAQSGSTITTPTLGVGNTKDLGAGIHVKVADASVSAVNSAADELVLENSASCGLSIFSGTSEVGKIAFGDSGDNNVAEIFYNHSINEMIFTVNTAETLRLGNSMDISTGGEDAPDVSDGGICLDQGADDTAIMTAKSSDVAHSMTGVYEADTYFVVQKHSAANGGTRMVGIAEDDPGFVLRGFANTSSGSVNSSTNAMVHIDGAKTDGGTSVTQISNDNLVMFSNNNSGRAIITGNGNIYSDASSTVSTFDHYDDAQLVRAWDLTHKEGVIDSKFDKFVKYNHEKLAELELVGREDDGTPNMFVNVTGFQKLHNGAIWQQYEKHQRLAEAVYEMAKEALGEDKADAILEKHDIKLLN